MAFAATLPDYVPQHMRIRQHKPLFPCPSYAQAHMEMVPTPPVACVWLRTCVPLQRAARGLLRCTGLQCSRVHNCTAVARTCDPVHRAALVCVRECVCSSSSY
uniref:Uncharacterized protein n=1 Tax=Eutreptiella gymnastica TaxID=73025 RepID=A0A7S4CJ29_9EUGL